jgi:hypothetical protein
MGNVFLALFVFAVVAAVAFTDWFFPVRPDCPSCGNEMFRSTVLCTCDGAPHHVPCSICHQCGAEIVAHSQGAAQRLKNWWKKGRSSRKPATP